MKHVRIWVEYGQEGDRDRTFGHPMSCRELDTWCAVCGCCEHCFHHCSCARCGCATAIVMYPPRVVMIEDET